MLSITQIARALHITPSRVRHILKKPFELAYVLGPRGPRGGNAERHYTISIVVPRVKDHGFDDPDNTRKLLVEGGYIQCP